MSDLEEIGKLIKQYRVAAIINAYAAQFHLFNLAIYVKPDFYNWAYCFSIAMFSFHLTLSICQYLTMQKWERRQKFFLLIDSIGKKEKIQTQPYLN